MGTTFEVTRVRRAESAGFSPSSKSALFYTCIHLCRCCCGCIDLSQHRLLTASVSHGGPFSLLLPLCVLRSTLFLRKPKTVLSFSGLSMGSHGRPSPRSRGAGGNSLHSIWRWLDIHMSSGVRRGGFLSKWARVFPCIIADPWSMGRCRRRWMNGSLAGIMDLSHGRVGRTQRGVRARPPEGKPYFNVIEKCFRSSFDSSRCVQIHDL